MLLPAHLLPIFTLAVTLCAFLCSRNNDKTIFFFFRFEHREENRKDCLRTLFSLIEEAGKANKMVDDARASYVKDRLRANPAFMERLRAKVLSSKGSNSIHT